MDGSDNFGTSGPVSPNLQSFVLRTSEFPKSEIPIPLPCWDFSDSLLLRVRIKPRASFDRSNDYQSMYTDLMAQTCSSTTPFLHYLDMNPWSRSSRLIQRQLSSPLELALSSQTLEDFPNSKGFDLCFSSVSSTPLGLACVLKDVVPPELLGF
jgi:hypothetical protein